MLQCWSSDPSKRPDFSELASTLDSNLESVAGYMEVRMNLVPANPEGEDVCYEIIAPEGVEGSHGNVPTGEGAMFENQVDLHPDGSGQGGENPVVKNTLVIMPRHRKRFGSLITITIQMLF